MALILLRTHDTTITIDDEPVRVHIRRMDRDEALAFEREYIRYGSQRGTADQTEVERDAAQHAARQFLEDSITKYVSVEAGDINDDGSPVVSGNDIIRTFSARSDVLMAFYSLIYAENFLGKSQKLKLRGRAFLSPGSSAPVVTAGSEADRPANTATAEVTGDTPADAPDKVH